MYTQYFGLSEPLFGIAQNPEKLYLGAANRIAFRQLVDDLTVAKKAVVLCGPAGSGKTTIVRKAVKDLPFPTQLIEVQSNEFKLNELIRYIESRFAVGGSPSASLIQRISNLKQALRKKQVERVVILIEQAHRIEADLIDGVQLLTQSDTGRSVNIQFVFVGTPESANRLNHIALRNFESHELGLCEIKPLDLEEIPEYLRHYLDQAGCKNESLFNAAAIERVKQLSGGVPRLINLLCNGGMLAAYLEDKDNVDAAMIDEASNHCLYPDIENLQSEPGHKRIELPSKGGHLAEKVSIVQGWPFNNGIADPSPLNDRLNALVTPGTAAEIPGELQDLAESRHISSSSIELPKRLDESKNLPSESGSAAVSENIWDRLSSNGSQVYATDSLATAESVDHETTALTTDYLGSGGKAMEKIAKGSWPLFPEMISKAAKHNQSFDLSEDCSPQNPVFPIKQAVSTECTDEDKLVQKGPMNTGVNVGESISSELNDGYEAKIPKDAEEGSAEDSNTHRLDKVDAPFGRKTAFSSVRIDNSEPGISPAELTENHGSIIRGSKNPGLMTLSEMIGKASEQSGRITDNSVLRVFSNINFNIQDSDDDKLRDHGHDNESESTEKIKDLIQKYANIEQKPKITSTIFDNQASLDADSTTKASGSGLPKSESEVPREFIPDAPGSVAVAPPPFNSSSSTAVALIVLAIGIFLTIASLKAPIEVVEITDKGARSDVKSGDLGMVHDFLALSPRPFRFVTDENKIVVSPHRTNHGNSVQNDNIDLPKVGKNSPRSSHHAQIEKLVKLAEEQISKKQLMTPENDNALATYHEIMQLAPEQSIGPLGVTRIKEIYMQWARAEVRRGNIPHAKFLYGKALKVVPGDDEVFAAMKELTLRNGTKHSQIRAKQSMEYSGFISPSERIAELLERASRQMYLRHLVKPVGGNAYGTYREVLRLDPGNREALDGLQWIKTTLVNWANSAMANRDWGRAEVFFLRALKVAPNDQQVISKFDEFKLHRARN